MLTSRLASTLRRHAWVLNLAFIAGCAYFVAGAANAVLGHAIRLVPQVDDLRPAGGRQAAKVDKRPGLHKIADRNLLALKREELAPPSQGEDSAPTAVYGRDFKESELHTCTLPAVLRATVVADNNPEWSLAVMLNNATRETQVYSIVEPHNKISEDAFLVAVRSREVIVRRRDHFERCLGEGEGAPPPPPVATASGPAEPAEPGKLVAGDMSGVTKFSETEYKVDRSELDKTLANLNEVATQARIVPSFRNGQPNGFKLFSIRPGSIYSKIGLQNGDVIQKINGFEMNSPDRALEIYTRLRDATSLTIELQRRGGGMTVHYKIQ